MINLPPQAENLVLIGLSELSVINLENWGWAHLFHKDFSDFRFRKVDEGSYAEMRSFRAKYVQEFLFFELLRWWNDDETD